jgi:phosphatidylglycerol:prolipoprotein diacylglycerol transferase
VFPKLFSAGGFFLPTYGVLVALGFLTALWLAARLARRDGLDGEAVSNVGVYSALVGLGGAKLLMFAFDFDYYRGNPREIFSLSTLQSGGVFYGGVVLAVVFAVFYMRRRGLPRWRVLDAFAPGVAAGHAIGRLGCFAAGCCWGLECRRPWAVTFTNPEAHELTGVPLNVALHPAQLYEAAAEAAIFGITWRAFGRPHHHGSVFGLYLCLYSVARFVIEFFRAHSEGSMAGPLSIVQWIAIALAGAGIWLIRRR